MRVNLGKLEEARKDYTSAIRALEAANEAPDPASEMLCIGSAEVSVSRYSGSLQSGVADYCVYVPALPDLLLRRARIALIMSGELVESAEADLAQVVALAREEGALQPYALLYRVCLGLVLCLLCGSEGVSVSVAVSVSMSVRVPVPVAVSLCLCLSHTATTSTLSEPVSGPNLTLLRTHLWTRKGDARMRLARYADAAADYRTAAEEFSAVGGREEEREGGSEVR